MPPGEGIWFLHGKDEEQIAQLRALAIVAGKWPNPLCAAGEKRLGRKNANAKNANSWRWYDLAPLRCCNPRLSWPDDRRYRGRLRADLSDQADSHFGRRGSGSCRAGTRPEIHRSPWTAGRRGAVARRRRSDRRSNGPEGAPRWLHAAVQHRDLRGAEGIPPRYHFRPRA